MARIRKQSPWLKETSQRSGFDNFDRFGKKRWRGIKQNGLLIAPDEFDTPPPSTNSLGGADINQGDIRTNWDSTSVPSVSAQQIQYVTASGGIRLNNSQPWLLVTGSNQAITISANPQVELGAQGQVLAIQCIGSTITIQDGNGLDLAGGQAFVMLSGAIIDLICNRTDNLWVETSRVQNGGI